MLHRLAHWFRLNTLELIVIYHGDDWRTFFRCTKCGEVEE